jgi:TetR/AcrR family transcriptional repressor of nem operon
MLLEKGLGAAGMRDVMAGADLTPGGFYRHFRSKDQLVGEANQAAFDRLIAKLESETAGKSPAQAIERIVFMYLHQSQSRERHYLCPLAMLGSELRHCDPTVSVIASGGYQRLVELIAKHLPDKNRSKALATASGIVSTMVGAVTLAGIASDSPAANTILSNAQVFVKGLLPGGDPHPQS